jgi:hypothetical protein
MDGISWRAITTPLMQAELTKTTTFHDAEMASGNGFDTANGIAYILPYIIGWNCRWDEAAGP